MKKPKVTLKHRHQIVPPIMSVADLAKLGGGRVAYIKEMNPKEAKELFPEATFPPGADVYSVHGADGTPLALTDSRRAAVGHAIGANLELAYVH